MEVEHKTDKPYNCACSLYQSGMGGLSSLTGKTTWSPLGFCERVAKIGFLSLFVVKTWIF